MILCLSAAPPPPAVGRVIEFRLAQDPWTENGITWANQPGTSGSSNAAFLVPSFAGCVSFAVKDDIEEWLEDGDNYGWMFADDDEQDASMVQFHSREAAIEGLRPTLNITFSN